MIREYSRNDQTFWVPNNLGTKTNKYDSYKKKKKRRQTNMTKERDKTTTETFAKQKTKPNKDSMMHIITYSD